MSCQNCLCLTCANNGESLSTKPGEASFPCYYCDACIMFIALTLMSTSSSLPYLRELEAKRRLITVSVQDANDADSFAMSADNCRILKMPDAARQKEQGTVTVNIYVPSMVLR